MSSIEDLGGIADPEAVFGHDDDEIMLPPEEPSLPPAEWIRKNLFSSKGSGVLTVLFGLLVWFAYRGVLNFAFHNPSRKWAAVPTNIRLMLTQSYPEAQYVRIWFSLGIIIVLAGLTLGVVRSHPMINLRKVLSGSMTLGAFLALSALIIKNNIQTDADGEFVRDEFAEVLRVDRGEALSGRWWVFALAALLIGVAGFLWFKLGDRRRFIFIPFLGVIYSVLGLMVLSLWVVPYGKYGLLPDGTFLAEKGATVAATTQGPWTVMWVLLGLSWFVGNKLLPSARALKVGLYLSWFLAPYVIIFVVLRDPELDWGHVFSTDIPMFLAFAIIGGAVLYFLTNPSLGEIGRIIAFGLLMLAAFHWLAAFFGWYPMLQKARLSFLVLAFFALAAANFAGPRKVRLGYVATWVGAMAVMHYLITMVNTPSTLDIQGGDDFIGGYLLSLVVAVFSLTLAFPVGVMFALARTSKLPIFRVLSTIFIEMSRGVPLITVLFFFATIIPLFLPQGMTITKLAAAVVALVLFSAAYVAENIRGGLQSVRRGQFEAADAMGLNTSQRVGLIVLPQALRVSIPPLVGQAIATYKETSLLAIIGLFDFLFIAGRVIPAQTQFISQRFEPLLFVSAIYWIGAYSMSRYSRSLEQRLGVGSR